MKSTIISQIEVVGGSYAFTLPLAYYPDYKKHGAKSNDDFPYEFSYDAQIISRGPITNMSIPDHTEIVEQNAERNKILVRCTQVSKTIELYYKTADMMIPSLTFARSTDSDKIAVQASLVPTFDPVEPQDAFNVVTDEKPEQIKLSSGADFHFFFIVDRSGSMTLSNRMRIAKDALKLFVRSLPKDSTFTVISFGSNFDCLEYGSGGSSIVFNDAGKNYALE